MPARVTLTLAPASFDSRRRAFIEGHGGGTLNGARVLLPGTGAAPDRYLWWSQDDGTGRQCNMDPGDHVAALSGWTGVEIELGPGIVSAADRAAATRVAAALVAGWTVTGAGADVVIRGSIDPLGVELGDAYVDRGAAGLFGHHTTTSSTNGNPLNDAIAVHGTFTAGPAVVTAVGVLLNQTAGEQVRVALYVGGTSSSFTGTTLVAEGHVSASAAANTFAWLPLTAAQASMLADNASVWVVAKYNNAHPTDGIHPAFSTLANREDWTERNLVIFTEAGITADPTVAFPASLAGLEGQSDIATGNAVVMMAAFEYRADPLCGDASLGGVGTAGLALGMHTDGVLGASASALTAPDAGGANVLASLTAPALGGMLLTRNETACRDVSGGQFRRANYTGGAVGNPNGATRLQDSGQLSGAAVAWVGQNVSPEVALAASSVLHMAIRGNGGIEVMFAASGAEAVASPPDDPSDFATTATDEYETNTANPAHSTNDAVAFETPFATDADDMQPGNYPGLRVRFRVPGDTLVSAEAVSGARRCLTFWAFE